MGVRRVAAAALTVGLLAGGTAGCGEAVAPRASVATVAPTVSATAEGGDRPSAATAMVCSGYLRKELAGALGVDTTALPVPRWEQRRYSCDYPYPDGVMTLVVKELPDRATAVAEFDGLRGSAGEVADLSGLGEAAYRRADGTTVVRKDSAVLTVDVGRLPAVFGNPSRSRGDVAVVVATTVMICWREHVG